MSPVTDGTVTRERTAVELVKEASAHLRGSIAEELRAPGDAFSADTVHLTKFHGFYQQDDRDVRRARTAAKLPLLSSCMVRAAVPGGVLTARQWLAMDRLAEQVARTAPRGAGAPAPNLRVTTRQGVQFHFVAKAEIRPLIAALNAELVTTLAACGDVARNVMGCPAPLAERNGLDLAALAQPLAAHVRPRTPAYYELWLDGEKAASVHAAEPGPANTSGSDVEPLYGDTYLPRKFKIAIAWPGDNCVDLFSHDLGFVPTFAGPAGPGTLEGFT
ncbi:MAG: sulfite reductase, partial [Ilumatobacter sp.]|nr:sulfite reductase [Ilumatobacter sp.]